MSYIQQACDPTFRRLTALARFDVMDSGAEADFDDLAALAALTCGAEFAAIAFSGSDRHWFKARHGLRMKEVPIADPLFSAVIHAGAGVATVVGDAAAHPTFSGSSLVSGVPNTGFFAAVPLVTRNGVVIGAVAVMDITPRGEFSDDQQRALFTVAKQVMAQLELRAVVPQLAATLCEKAAAKAEIELLRGMLPMCGSCHSVREETPEYWEKIDAYLSSHPGKPVAPDLCRECNPKGVRAFQIQAAPPSLPRLTSRRF